MQHFLTKVASNFVNRFTYSLYVMPKVNVDEFYQTKSTTLNRLIQFSLCQTKKLGIVGC